MTTSFTPCSAKLPIVALVSGALFSGAWWVALRAYFVGCAAILLSGLFLKRLKPFRGGEAPLVMELPNHHIPTARSLLRVTWGRVWPFVKRAGTIILLAFVFIWFGFAAAGSA